MAIHRASLRGSEGSCYKNYLWGLHVLSSIFFHVSAATHLAFAKDGSAIDCDAPFQSIRILSNNKAQISSQSSSSFVSSSMLVKESE